MKNNKIAPDFISNTKTKNYLDNIFTYMKNIPEWYRHDLLRFTKEEKGNPNQFILTFKSEEEKIDLLAITAAELDRDIEIYRAYGDDDYSKTRVNGLSTAKAELTSPAFHRIINPKNPLELVNYDINQSSIINLKAGNDQTHSIIVIDNFHENSGLRDQIQYYSCEEIQDQVKKYINSPSYISQGWVLYRHGLQVASIIKQLPIKVEILPKPVTTGRYCPSEEEVNYTKKLFDQIAADKEAKIINISQKNAVDPNQMKLFCQNHIVVLAGCNDSSVYDGELAKIINEPNQDYLKHLLVVVNVDSDGQSISPSSNIPGSNKLFQSVTVGAPGYMEMKVKKTKDSEITDAKETGTSYSTPWVSKLALAISVLHPELTLAQVVSIIKQTCNKEGNLSDSSLFGHGMIDYDAALTLADTTLQSQQDSNNFESSLVGETSSNFDS